MNLAAMTRFEWERVVMRVQMPTTTKLVALALATFANRNGENVRPGNRRLAQQLGVTERTVERQLAWLREHGLLMQTFRSRARGRASVYRLAIAENLPDLVRFISDRPDTDDGSDLTDDPTQMTGHDEDDPTSTAGRPDTGDRRPDTGDANDPTRVTAQQAIQQATTTKEVSPSAPLRVACEAADLSRFTQAARTA